MLDKNLLFGFAAGCVLGALGCKFYNEHKSEIDEKLKGLKGFNGFGNSEGDAEAAPETDNQEVSLEELEAQKERLEDLIAEMQSKQSAQ